MTPKTQKCPLCGGRMVEGILLDRSRNEMLQHHAQWHDAVPGTTFLGGLKLKEESLRAVGGYRCKECCYVMLFAY